MRKRFYLKFEYAVRETIVLFRYRGENDLIIVDPFLKNSIQSLMKFCGDKNLKVSRFQMESFGPFNYKSEVLENTIRQINNREIRCGHLVIQTGTFGKYSDLFQNHYKTRLKEIKVELHVI